MRPSSSRYASSWIVVDGINLGCRMRITDTWRFALNFDMCHNTPTPLVPQSHVQNPIFVTAGYVGAGISYELQAADLSELLAGAGSGRIRRIRVDAVSEKHGKLRCGMRYRSRGGPPAPFPLTDGPLKPDPTPILIFHSSDDFPILAAVGFDRIF